MKQFYATFGQSSALRNGYLEFRADEETQVRQYMNEHHGQKWAFVYATRPKGEYFPAGRIGEVVDLVGVHVS